MSNLWNGGYSKQSTLEGNLIQGEDPSDKILDEGKKYLSQWKANSDAELVTQQTYLNKLENVFQAEKSNRADNEKLASFFVKGFGEALTTRHNQLLRNAQDKSSANEAYNEQLASAFKIGGNLAGRKVQQLVDKQVEFGRNLTVDLGLPHELLESLQTTEDLGFEANKTNNNAIYQARKLGYTQDQVEQLRNLNWFQKRGVAIGRAQNLGNNYHHKLISRITDEFPTRYGGVDGKTSLAQATSTLNMSDINLALSKIREGVLAENKDISDYHLAKYVRPGILAAEAKVREDASTRIAKQANEAYNERELGTVVSLLRESPEKLHKYLKSKFGPNEEFRSAAWNSTTNYIIQGIKNGSLNRADIEAWREFPFDGVEGSRSIEEHHRTRWMRIEEALAATEQAAGQRAMSQETLRKGQLSQDTENLRNAIMASETPPTRAELSSMSAQAMRLHGDDNKMSKMLMSMSRDHVSEANDDLFIPWLDELEAQGLLTPSIVHNANLTWVKRTEYIKKANANSPYAATETQIKMMDDYVEKKIERAIQAFGLESKHVPSSAMALYEGKASLKRYFRTYAQKAGANSREVYDAAIGAFNKEFQDNYQLIEFQGGARAPYFKNFAIGSNISPVPLSEITTQELSENPNILKEKLFVDGVNLKKFLDNAQMGVFNGWPSDIMHLQSKIGRGPQGQVKTDFDILEEQIEAAKIAGILDKNYKLPPSLVQAHKVAFNSIKPEWRKYVCGSRCNRHSAAASILYSGFNHETNKDLVATNKGVTRSPYRKYYSPALTLEPNSTAWVDALFEGNYV